jgi:hypothetical protein
VVDVCLKPADGAAGELLVARARVAQRCARRRDATSCRRMCAPCSREAEWRRARRSVAAARKRDGEKRGEQRPQRAMEHGGRPSRLRLRLLV